MVKFKFYIISEQCPINFICIKIFGDFFLVHMKIFGTKKSFLPSVNLIRPGLMSLLPGSGVGSEGRMPKIKIPINRMKLNLARVIEAMTDAKFEFGSLFSSGYMTSQNFPLEKGRSH